MLHVKLMAMKQRTRCKQIVCPFIHPQPLDGVNLKGKCRTLCKFDLMHTPDLLGLVKRSDIEIMQKVYLFKLSELIVFSYGQSDIKDELRC